MKRTSKDTLPSWSIQLNVYFGTGANNKDFGNYCSMLILLFENSWGQAAFKESC